MEHEDTTLEHDDMILGYHTQRSCLALESNCRTQGTDRRASGVKQKAV